MKTVLASLKPYYYYLIGEKIKTEEIRKKFPKTEDWDKRIAFYMSKDEKSFAKIPKELQEKYRAHFGKVGLFCECGEINLYNTSWLDGEDRLKETTCLNDAEIMDYMNNYTYKHFFGWDIKSATLEKEPREIDTFIVEQIGRDCGYGNYNVYNKVLTRPPQSYCYVESESK